MLCRSGTSDCVLSSNVRLDRLSLAMIKRARPQISVSPEAAPEPGKEKVRGSGVLFTAANLYPPVPERSQAVIFGEGDTKPNR